MKNGEEDGRGWVFAGGDPSSDISRRRRRRRRLSFYVTGGAGVRPSVSHDVIIGCRPGAARRVASLRPNTTAGGCPMELCTVTYRRAGRAPDGRACDRGGRQNALATFPWRPGVVTGRPIQPRRHGNPLPADMQQQQRRRRRRQRIEFQPNDARVRRSYRFCCCCCRCCCHCRRRRILASAPRCRRHRRFQWTRARRSCFQPCAGLLITDTPPTPRSRLLRPRPQPSKPAPAPTTNNTDFQTADRMQLPDDAPNSRNKTKQTRIFLQCGFIAKTSPPPSDLRTSQPAPAPQRTEGTFFNLS